VELRTEFRALDAFEQPNLSIAKTAFVHRFLGLAPPFNAESESITTTQRRVQTSPVCTRGNALGNAFRRSIRTQTGGEAIPNHLFSRPG
jgi:hypothetical protein